MPELTRDDYNELLGRLMEAVFNESDSVARETICGVIVGLGGNAVPSVPGCAPHEFSVKEQVYFAAGFLTAAQHPKSKVNQCRLDAIARLRLALSYCVPAPRKTA